MKRIQLRFENMQQVVGSNDISVILLTDENRERALSIVCDDMLSRQLLLRLQSPDSCKTMLPEALLQMLNGSHEMMIYGVHDGQYQVVLADTEFERNARIRISDAILLMVISDIPLYIEETLISKVILSEVLHPDPHAMYAELMTDMLISVHQKAKPWDPGRG